MIPIQNVRVVAGLALSPLLTQPKRPYRIYFADEGIFGFAPTGRCSKRRTEPETSYVDR